MKKIEQKSTALGIELGSTRIKAVLAGPDGSVLVSGAHDWENHFEGGYWTYPLTEVWEGIQDAYRHLAEEYQKTYGEPLTTVGALGVSAMMHGYLPSTGTATSWPLSAPGATPPPRLPPRR